MNNGAKGKIMKNQFKLSSVALVVALACQVNTSSAAEQQPTDKTTKTDKIEKIVQALLEKETLEKDEFNKLVA